MNTKGGKSEADRAREEGEEVHRRMTRCQCIKRLLRRATQITAFT